MSARPGLGAVDGLIGGYETGGDSPDVSYSVHLTDWAIRLLAEVEAGG